MDAFFFKSWMPAERWIVGASQGTVTDRHISPDVQEQIAPPNAQKKNALSINTKHEVSHVVVAVSADVFFLLLHKTNQSPSRVVVPAKTIQNVQHLFFSTREGCPIKRGNCVWRGDARARLAAEYHPGKTRPEKTKFWQMGPAQGLFGRRYQWPIAS